MNDTVKFVKAVRVKYPVFYCGRTVTTLSDDHKAGPAVELAFHPTHVEARNRKDGQMLVIPMGNIASVVPMENGPADEMNKPVSTLDPRIKQETAKPFVDDRLSQSAAVVERDTGKKRGKKLTN